MENITFNKATDIKIMPIRAASIESGGSPSKSQNNYYLEKGSYYASQEITMPHYEGGEEQQGHIIEVSMVIPQNEYNSNKLIDNLEEIISKSKMQERMLLSFIIGERSYGLAPGVYEPPAINSNHGLFVEMSTLCIFNYSIEQRDVRPRAILKGSGFAFKLNNYYNTTGGGETVMFYE